MPEEEKNVSIDQWFAIQTLSNQEGKVKRHLEKFVEIEGVEDCIKQVLLPTEMVSEVKNGKRTSRVRKFYPGYLFVNMDLYDEEGDLLQKPWHFVRGTEGVIGFLGGDHPVPLKEDEIDRILGQVKEAEGKEVPKIQYSIGDGVKITDGPFLSLTGNIEEVDVEHGKLKVSVAIFGRHTPVELEYWQVERIEG